MTETLQLRGRFAGVNLDELVDTSAVRTWLYWGMFWLVVTPSVGVTISGLFNFPDYLGTTQLGLTFGRLRPIHVNGVIFGAFSSLFIGECYYLVPRLCGVRVPWPQLGVPLAWVSNLGLMAGLVGLGFGLNHGLEAGELPLYAEIPIFIVTAAATAQFLVTIARRLESPLYVALWYLIGAFIWTTINLVLGSYILPYTISGINSAGFHGLYIHYIVGLWLTPAGYVLIYYYLPVSVRNPLYAHKLSLVGFWSLALFYPFVGIHHYLYSPIADWAETIAIVTSMLLIIPVWTVLINFFGTVKGKWEGFGRNLAGKVPDHGRAHVSSRLLPGLARGFALDPTTHPFFRLCHLALPSHRVRNVRGLGDGWSDLYLAATIRARAVVVDDGELVVLADNRRHHHHGSRADRRRSAAGLRMDERHRVGRQYRAHEALLGSADAVGYQHGYRHVPACNQFDDDGARPSERGETIDP